MPLNVTYTAPAGQSSVTFGNGLPAAPTAEFIGTPTSGTTPLAVTFTNQSTGAIDSFLWDFGDGTTSTATNPTKAYLTAASFTVALTAIGPGGGNTKTRPRYVVASAPSPTPGPPPPPSSPATPFVVARTGTRYATLAQAVAGAISGDTIKVAAGTYVIPSGAGATTTPGFCEVEISLEALTIEWETPGTRPVMDLSAWAQVKAAVGGQPIGINAGPNNRTLTVRGLELIGYRDGDSYGINSNAGYPSGNPASTLTVEYCKLVNWSDGVKTTYSNTELSVNLRYSTVEDCSAGSLTHGVYVQGNTLDALGCTFRTTVAGNPTGAAFLGHLIKSRMRVTKVRGCLFDAKGGGASCIEAPNGGDLEVYGNIVLKYNVGDPSNPPIKFGFEEYSTYLDVTVSGAAFEVGNLLVGQTSGATGTIVAIQDSGTRLVYRPTSGGTRFDSPGENILVGGIVRGVQVGARGGSIDGTSFDGRTHRVRIAQNTVRNEQNSGWSGSTSTAVGMLWISPNMTDDNNSAISNASILAAGFVRNNIVGDIGTGNRTVANISPEPQYADNSPVEGATISTTGTLGAYSGTPIAGSPSSADAAYAYAGEYTPPLARTDTFRGGRIAGLPAWRSSGWTPLAFQSITPTATIASLDPALDAALNGNGAGNVPPWTGASYPQAQMLNAWGAGAYNRTTKKLMILAAGGHNGYQGNEGYSVDLSAGTPTYTSMCPPSGSITRPATFNAGGFPVSGTTDEVCTDERPKAIHGYGGAVQDGSGRYFQMPGGAADDEDLDNVWTQRPYRFAGSDWNLTGAAPATGYSQPCTSVYDPDLAAIWCMWGSRTYRFSPETLAVVSTANTDGSPYYGTAAYANGYVMTFDGGYTGGLYLMVFATSAPGTYRYHKDGAGGTIAITGTAPPSPSNKYYSIAWDSIRGRLLVYGGGARMWTLTPPASGSWVTGTWAWAELTLSTATYNPGTDSGNGIFGRFFFDADLNCAICQPSTVTAPMTILPMEAA